VVPAQLAREKSQHEDPEVHPQDSHSENGVERGPEGAGGGCMRAHRVVLHERCRSVVQDGEDKQGMNNSLVQRGNATPHLPFFTTSGKCNASIRTVHSPFLHPSSKQNLQTMAQAQARSRQLSRNDFRR